MSDRKRWARWWVVCWNKKRGWLNIWIGRLLDGIRRPLDCVHTHNRQLRSSDTFPYTHRERNEDLFIPAGSTDVRSIESNEYHHQKVFFFLCFFLSFNCWKSKRNLNWNGSDVVGMKSTPRGCGVEITTDAHFRLDFIIPIGFGLSNQTNWIPFTQHWEMLHDYSLSYSLF